MSGYIGNIPTPQATQTRQSFTATASQTSFATVGYTAGFLDVYLNGVHLLDGTDYTATNGSDIVLTTGAALDDVVEFVAYETFSVSDQSFTGTTTTEALTTTGAFTSLGIDDNATSTAMTLTAAGEMLTGTATSKSKYLSVAGDSGSPIVHFEQVSGANSTAGALALNRQNLDGVLLDLRKGGTTVGTIGTRYSDLMLGTAATGLRFYDQFNAVTPWDMTTNDTKDGVISLGQSGDRFKDLYLEGGVYLGGTGVANKLDDYEEGTWTPTASSGSLAFVSKATYTKVGRLVNVTASCQYAGNGAGAASIANFPFAVSAATASAATVRYTNIGVLFTGHVNDSGSGVNWYFPSGASVTYANFGTGRVDFSAVYLTDS